jgi:hypothetical protein
LKYLCTGEGSHYGWGKYSYLHSGPAVARDLGHSLQDIIQQPTGLGTTRSKNGNEDNARGSLACYHDDETDNQTDFEEKEDIDCNKRRDAVSPSDSTSSTKQIDEMIPLFIKELGNDEGEIPSITVKKMKKRLLA